MTPRSFFRQLSKAFCVAGIAFSFAGIANAALRTVTDSSDNPGAPVAGSLRKIIEIANPGDTIEFGPAITGTITLGGVELLIDKNLTISGPGAQILAISGNNASRVFKVAGGTTVSLSGLTIRDGKAPNGTDGADADGPGAPADGGPASAGESGGGILNEGDLTVSQCAFISNHAGKGGEGGAASPFLSKSGGAGGNGGVGGAIHLMSGSLVVSQTSFISNGAGAGGDGGRADTFTPGSTGTGGLGGAGGNGGAIYSASALATALQLSTCEFQSNASGRAGNTGDGLAFTVAEGGRGGAISSSSGGGTILNSTFADNTAGSGGSALGNHVLPLGPLNPNRNAIAGTGGNGGALDLLGGQWSLTNCTLSGNRAGNSGPDGVGFGVSGTAGSGGAIYSSGGLTLVSCTIAGNLTGTRTGSSGSGGGAYGDGGGIRTTNSVGIQNTILAGNSAAFGSGPDLKGTAVSASHNFIGVVDGSTGITNGTNSDLAGTAAAPLNALLGPLGDNGGGVSTRVPLAGSPVIDAGDDALVGTDQRGEPRLAGSHVDIGAVEAATTGPGSSEFVFVASSSSIAETGGTLQIAVARLGNSPSAASVNYTTSAGSAAAGSDYTTTSGTLNFAAGEGTKTITVPIFHDVELEGAEVFEVVLSQPSNGSTLGVLFEHSVTIQNSPVPQFAFAVASSSIGEGAGAAQIAVSRTGDTSEAATVSFAATAGSATAGSDYTSVTGILSFAAGEPTKTIVVPVVHDAEMEGDENFQVTLSQPSSGNGLGTITQHVVTIQDNTSSIVSFTTQTLRVAEKHGLVRIVITRTGPLLGGRSVEYAVTGGTAETGSDLPLASGLVEFAAGESSKVIEVAINKDRMAEGDEVFSVALSSPSAGVTLGTNSTLAVTLADKVRRPEIYHGISFSQSDDQIGDVTVTTTVVDRFTAVVRFAGGTYRLAGQFGAGGTFSLERSVKVLGVPGAFRFTLSPGATLSSLAGTATNPANGKVHAFQLERAAVGSVAQYVPGAGYYTAILSAATPAPLRGYLTARVRPNGLTSLLGALPDGTRVSQTTHVTGAGNLAIYFPVYRAASAGYLGGSASLTGSGSLPFGGDMIWEKPAGTPRFGGSAFVALPVDLSGAPYVKPSGGRVIDDFDSTNGAAYLHFYGGSLGAALTSMVTLDTANRLGFALGDARKPKLSLNAKTGIFSGTFLHPDGKRHQIWGACVQQAGAPDAAQGFFIESSATGVVELTTNSTPPR